MLKIKAQMPNKCQMTKSQSYAFWYLDFGLDLTFGF
jgi:hypothetical protein